MKIIDIFNDYINISKVINRQGTVKYNVSCLAYVKKYFNSVQIETVNQFLLIKYNEFIRWFRLNTNLKNSSINKVIVFIKVVLNTNNIVLNGSFKKLKDDSNNYEPFDNNEKVLIYEALNKINNKNQNFSYKVAINLLFDTGCRISELLEIKVKNIDLKSNEILLETTKNGKNRYVFFTEKTKEVLSGLLLNCSNEYLFFNIYRRRKVLPEDIRCFFVKKLKPATGIKKIHAHRFRKTFAMDLYLKNIDLFTIMTLLGHKDLKTTQIYLSYSKEFIKRQYFLE